MAQPKKASEVAFLVREPQPLLRLIGNLRVRVSEYWRSQKSQVNWAALTNEPQTLLRLIGNLRVRDSRYTPYGVVRSTDQREYRIARPAGARPKT